MSSYVYLKRPSGKTYVYENTTIWDRETKKCRHLRKCVGHLDPNTKEILPNRRKGDAPKAPAPEKAACSVLVTGTFSLLDHVAQKTGLASALRHIFPGDCDRILTCAYYLASEGKALCHAGKWSEQNRTPLGVPLSSQRISELLVRITPALQQAFFLRWAGECKCDEYYAMDITSVSSYSEALPFVRYGYNRDGEKLPQINLLMVAGEQSHLPISYRILPGSIRDVSTFRESIAQMEISRLGRMHIVTDKGFFSEGNIDALYAAHYRFLLGVPFTAGLAKEAVEEFRDGIRSHRNYCQVSGDELYAATKPARWKGHRCYIHIYYDSTKAEAAHKRFDHELLRCYEELVEGKPVKEHAEYYAKFFHVKETPKRGRKVEYDEEAITRHKKDTLGWLVLITNDIKDPVRALKVYRQKDAIEKGFDDLKNDLDMKRLRIHSITAMDGRIFLQFIALILTARLKAVMDKHGWFRNHDLQEVLEEVKSIREVRLEGHRKRIVTTLTKFQAEIANLFQVDF